MEITQQELARRLLEAREFMGFSLEHAAEAIGSLTERLAAIESGAQSVNSLEIHRLAKLYGRSLRSLLVLEDEAPSQFLK